MVSFKAIWRAILLCALAASLVGLVNAYWYPLTVPKSVREGELRTLVLRQALREHLGNCGSPQRACCVSVQGMGDPSAAFLAQFNGQLTKGSECAWREFQPIEVKTGRPATIVNLTAVEWVGSLKAQLDGSFVCGGLCGVGVHFELHRWMSRWSARYRIGWES